LAYLLASLSLVACDDGSDPTNAAPAPDGWDPADPNFTPPTMADNQREK
jgi:hypothetical protein